MRVAADQFHRLVRAAWSPQAGTCFYRYITQRTTTPKALEEFKGEDDCNEKQMEKDCGEVRRTEAETMAAPPWIIKT